MDNYPNGFTTVTVMFTTQDANGAPVAPSSAFTSSDFSIYKNGSATQKTTTNGLTVTSPFDSLTGVHALIIDTSNNTGDTGFFATGAVYDVFLNTAKTVNTQSVARFVGKFSLDIGTGLVIESGLTLLGFYRLVASVLLSKVSGGGTATNTFRDYNDTKDRIVATADADGNRTAFGTRDQT